MQGRIIFLVEEQSMKFLLQGLLPRIFDGLKENEHFLCVTHEGKSDLDKSIPRKLRAWTYPHDRFVILRDNDNANCLVLKKKLLQICESQGRPETKVRLVCQELESWYIGDLKALAHAFSEPKFETQKLRKKFINPDLSQKPSVELQRWIPRFQKGSAARLMGQSLSKTNNLSRSFNVFISCVESLINDMKCP